MSNLFERGANKVRGSKLVIFIWFAFLVCFIASVALIVEDYWTSYEWYQSLPTKKIFPATSIAASLLPTLVTIVCTYMFAENTNRGWALLAVFFAIFIDFYSDMSYKAGWTLGVDSMGEMNGVNILYAGMETIILFTIGAELLLSMSFGMLLELWADFIENLGDLIAETIVITAMFIHKMRVGMAQGADALGVGIDNEHEGQQGQQGRKRKGNQQQYGQNTNY